MALAGETTGLLDLLMTVVSNTKQLNFGKIAICSDNKSILFYLEKEGTKK